MAASILVPQPGVLRPGMRSMPIRMPGCGIYCPQARGAACCASPVEAACGRKSVSPCGCTAHGGGQENTRLPSLYAAVQQLFRIIYPNRIIEGILTSHQASVIVACMKPVRITIGLAALLLAAAVLACSMVAQSPLFGPSPTPSTSPTLTSSPTPPPTP